MVEKASYTGPWQVPWKRAKKDPSAPKRPMSAFLFFSQGRRRTIKESNPDMKNTEVSRLLGEMWRNAPEEDRRPHIEKEKKEREKYKVAIADWRKDFEAKKEEEQRKLQESQQAAQWAQPYNPEGGDASSPQTQYAQPSYMPPPPGYAQYPPQPYSYRKYDHRQNLSFTISASSQLTHMLSSSQHLPIHLHLVHINTPHMAISL
jgi:high mobility group protein B1